MLRRIKALLLRNDSARQTVLKNTFWLFAGELLGRVIRFSIVVYSARILGAADYGVFSYALTIAAFVTIFSDIGISAVLTRETSKNADLRQSYFSSALMLKLILMTLNIGIIFLGIPLFARVEGALALLPMVIFIFVFDSLREFGFGFNRALEKMEREAAIKIVTNLAISILGFIALWVAPSITTLATSYAIGSAIGLLATLWLLREYVKQAFSAVDTKLIWPIFKLAWPIGLLGLLGATMINTDMVMLGWWVSPEQLGFYAAAQKIILLLYIVPALMASATFPAFSRLAGVNNERFRLIFEKTIAATELIAFPIAVGGCLVAPQLLTFLFGAEYAPGATTLAILFATLLVVFPSTILSNALFAYNQQKRFMIFVSLGVLSNIFFNWLLIPRYGIAGAGAATVISQVIANTFVWLQMRRVNRFTFLHRLPRVIGATIGMGGTVIALQLTSLSLIPIILIAGAVYAGLLWLLREPLLNEVKSVALSPTTDSGSL